MRPDQPDPVGEVRGVVEALGLEWAQAENITKQDFDAFRKYERAVQTIESNVAILERMLDALLPEREGDTSADRAARLVAEWAKENAHLIPHTSGTADFAEPSRPMRCGVGFHSDGSRGFHDQQSAVGYQLADEAFCRPGETEQDRQTRVAVDHAGEVIMQRAWAKDYCDRNMTGR